MYELKLEQFSGPLDKLLELIEARKLEISEISLARVTDDFLRYLAGLRDSGASAPVGAKAAGHSAHPDQTASAHLSRMRLLADFIVIASRLIFIKSRSLLPDLPVTSDEEAAIKDLEYRLAFYRRLKPAMKILAVAWQRDAGSRSRPYLLGSARIFYPGPDVTPERLHQAMAAIRDYLEKMVEASRVIQETIVTLEEKINEVILRMKEIDQTSFSTLTATKSRQEMIVTFLAILHLAREQLIFLEQTAHFSDIMIRNVERGA